MTERGFTLLETIVAFAALAVILGAVYGGLAAGTRSARAAGDYLEALARAETAIARAGVTHPLVAGTRERRDGRWTERVAITRDPATADAARVGLALYRVSADITWQDGAATRRVALATLKPGPAP